MTEIVVIVEHVYDKSRKNEEYEVEVGEYVVCDDVADGLGRRVRGGIVVACLRAETYLLSGQAAVGLGENAGRRLG